MRIWAENGYYWFDPWWLVIPAVLGPGVIVGCLILAVAWWHDR